MKKTILGLAGVPVMKRRVSYTWTAIQDTFFSTKETFERHRIVFTIGTSIASVATAWAGYSLRHLHQSKLEHRLESIEKAMAKVHNVEEEEIRKIVNSGNVSYPTCAATAGMSLLLGYALGWRGGKWYANRLFRKQQIKLQKKPQQTRFLGSSNIQAWRLLRRPFLKPTNQSKADTKVLPLGTADCEKTQLM